MDWKDISEAPTDGTFVLAYWTVTSEGGTFALVSSWFLDGRWMNSYEFGEDAQPTHFVEIDNWPADLARASFYKAVGGYSENGQISKVG